MLTFSQCCVPRNVTVNVTIANGTDSALVNTRCSTLANTQIVLDRLIVGIAERQLCLNQLQKRGNDLEAFDTISAFRSKCVAEVIGTDGSPPVCTTDRDCWTNCDMLTNTCLVPYDNPAPVLVDCFLANMHPELQRYIRKHLNLTATSSNDELAAAFATTYAITDCRGPTAPLHVGNETACLADSECNWDPRMSSQACTNSSGLRAPRQFCGECYDNR